MIDLNINILPFSSNASAQDRKATRRQEMEVSSTLSHLLLPHLLNRNNLVVLEGRYVWRLNIDILVTHCEGNLMDSCSMAIWGALQKIRLPSVVPIENASQGTGANSNATKKTSDEVMLDSDIANSVTPEGVLDCPIIVTVYLIPALDGDEKELSTLSSSTTTNTSRKVKKKHQNVMIVDASKLEESCASTKVSISIDGIGNVCGVHKYGTSSVLGNYSGNIKYDMLPKIQSVALSSSQSVFAMLKRSQENGSNSTVTMNPESMYDNFFRAPFEVQ